MMHRRCPRVDVPTPRHWHVGARRSDDGMALLFVLVAVVIISLIVIPLLAYTTTVLRTSRQQTDRAQAVENARGGVWMALTKEVDIFANCSGGPLPSRIPDVSTTCTVVGEDTLREAASIPFHAGVVQVGKTLPPEIATSAMYTNPAAGGGPADAWIADTRPNAEAGSLWLPVLPLPSTSTNPANDTMSTNPFPPYSSCRVLFPGTYNTEVVLTEPTFFVSGVYYFTAPLVIGRGADVVVGFSNDASRAGCTTDTLSVNVSPRPATTNRSGLGATLVLGADAQIRIDDTIGTGDIRFIVNPRFVAAEEVGVAASAGVSIISVNGDPLQPAGGDLVIDGVLNVPQSTAGIVDSPPAVEVGYRASNLTPGVTAPDAPTVTTLVAGQRGTGTDRGRLTVTWDVPASNGSPITGYTATHSPSGQSCSPADVVTDDIDVQPTCTITGLEQEDADGSTVTVVATNATGDSGPSVPLPAPLIDLATVATFTEPDAPQAPAVGDAYSDGVEINWNPTPSDGGSPVVGYRVTATTVDADPITGDFDTVECFAPWNATSCVLPFADGLIGGTEYDVEVVALQREFAPGFVEYESTPALLTGVVAAAPGTGASPGFPSRVATPRVPDPILSFTTTTDAAVDISVPGYISVPQGRVELGAASATDNTSIELVGGLLAADIVIDPAAPTELTVELDNPVGQRTMTIQSTATAPGRAVATAVVQVNESRSTAINSWSIE